MLEKISFILEELYKSYWQNKLLFW